jgi:thiamine biosynthesis lipoprotein
VPNPEPAVAADATRVSLRRAKPWLGTLVDIHVEADDAESARRALGAAFAEIAGVHHLMSFHDAHSDLGRLNRARPGTPVEVDARTAAVLRHAADFCTESDGAFDAAAAGVLIELGLLPAVSERRAAGLPSLPPTLAPQGERCTVIRGKHPIDLGGIAKGYAVDRAIEVLIRHGVASALVNAGGDLRQHGATPVTVHLRDPADPSRLFGSVVIGNAALASSATSGLEGPGPAMAPRPSSLIDMHRRRPLADGAGVSIVAPTCLLADVLTKVVLVSGDPEHPMLRRHGARVLLHRSPGDVPA